MTAEFKIGSPVEINSEFGAELLNASVGIIFLGVLLKIGLEHQLNGAKKKPSTA